MTACGPKAKSAERVAMSALAPQSRLVMLTVSSSPFDPNLPLDAARSAIVRGPSAAHDSDGTCTAFLRPDLVKLLCAT